MFSFALTLVRHGETQYNKDGLLQGQGIDSPLSEIGIEQSEAAGQYLQDVHFSHVFASDMKRARQTAEIIVRRNKTCRNLDIVIDPLLKERSFGVAEGGKVEDMKSMAKAAGQTIPEFTPPHGETMEQVKVRIGEFLKKMFQLIAELHGGRVRLAESTKCDSVVNAPIHVLVVTHGAYMRVAVRYFMEDLVCSVPPDSDMTQLFSACSNTGMCQFIVTLRCCDSAISLSGMECVFVNRREHIKT